MKKTLLKTFKITMLIIVVTCLAVLVFLSFKSASNEADWQTQFKILPSVELSGDTIDIKNVRDFRYNADGTIAEARYINQRYQLSEFKNAWYGISHFGPNGLAHVFMSFEFSNDQFLVVSIEARLEEKHLTGYNPIKGLFRAYNKTIVLATEQDVIGLRTHIRKESVNLYKFDVPELYIKPLFLNFLREAQVLNRKPKFYNTLVDNCMTGLLAQSDQFRSISSWLDTRILLPGKSDKIIYELGYIDTTKPFDEQRKASVLDPSIVEIDDTDFSRKLRQ